MRNEALLKLLEKEPQESAKIVEEAIKLAYNKGVWHGGFALAGGAVIGAVIDKGIKYFKAKKRK